MFAALSSSLLLRVQFFLVHSMEEIILKKSHGYCRYQHARQPTQPVKGSASKEQVNVRNHCKRHRRTHLNCKVIPLSLSLEVNIWSYCKSHRETA